MYLLLCVVVSIPDSDREHTPQVFIGIIMRLGLKIWDLCWLVFSSGCKEFGGGLHIEMESYTLFSRRVSLKESLCDRRCYTHFVVKLSLLKLL